MNITYVTNFPSIDVKYWSGIVYFMAKHLEKRASVDFITDLREAYPFSLRVKNRLFNRNKIYRIDRSPEIGREFARQISKRLKPSTDIIFSPSSTNLAYLNTNKPKVFYTDATFASMINYYDYFTNLSPRYIKEGMKIEQLALDSCSLAIYSSQWAADSAIRDYQIDPEKIKVVPFGANISTKHLSLDDVKSSLKAKDGATCKILFLAVDWIRKGGDIVVDTVKRLNTKMGLPTELHIVGIDDLPIDNLPPYIFNHGKISKATPEGMKKIENLITQSHFLFIPSRADCTPIVFSEAMSYGVPCVSAATGGIPSIVNDLNGIILDSDSGAIEYAQQIYNAFTDKTRYAELALSAFYDFESRLNWDVAMDKVIKHMKDL